MQMQRGFGLISLAIGLVAFAAISAALWAAWANFKDSIGAPYAAAQLASDQLVINKANAAEGVATLRAENAEADAKKAVDGAAMQGKAIADANALAAAAQKAAREAGAVYAATVAKQAGRITALQAQAAAAPVAGQSCTEVLGATDAILRGSQRARDALNIGGKQ